jgi:TPR repeat protein
MQGIALLATHYLSGPFATRNLELGTNWLWRGVQKGQALSMTQLGLLLNEGRLIPRDGNAAWALLSHSAELGHAPAQAIVAEQAFMTPPLISVSRALHYLTLATEQQWPPAIFKMSQLYLAGEHVPRDLVRAREYLNRAVELNDRSAQFNLGLTFLQGQFGETNESKAAVLFRSSAEQGMVSGQSAYANMVARGQGTERNLVEAWKWFELAAAQGDKNAPATMKILATHLTPAQIDEGRHRAKAFVATNREPPMYLSIPRRVPVAQ